MLIGLIILFLSALLLIWGFLVGILVHELMHPPRHTAGWALAHRRPVDPEQVGYHFSSPTTFSVGSHVLPTWIVQGHPSKVSDARTIIFVHGWGQSRLDMLPLLSTYSRYSNRIVLYDLPGHGEAGGASSLGSQDVENLLGLLTQIDDESYVLVGCSMGAVIALAAAAHSDPMAGRISSVIAYGVYLDFHKTLIARLRKSNYPARPISDVALWIMKLLGKRPLLLDHENMTVSCSVLLVAGENDRVASPQVAQSLADRMPDSAVVVIPNAENYKAWEYQADEHLDHLDRMFSS